MTLPRLAVILLLAWITLDAMVIGRYATSRQENRDRYSMAAILVANLVAWTVAIWLPGHGPGDFASMPVQVAGLVVMGIGIAVRSFAIAQLGRLHSPNVAVQADHRVVDTGLYKRIRHPSYLGAIIAFLGCAIALGNWISIAVVMVLTVPAYLFRIREEEAALAGQLGQPYRDYQARTHRLVPGVY
jgi:protein-S-isoprenylcysteine O-methyltransferase